MTGKPKMDRAAGDGPITGSAVLGPDPSSKVSKITSWKTRSLKSLALVASLTAAPIAVGLGCEPSFVVGEWKCLTGTEQSATSALDFVVPDAPLELPWSSSFEDGFCGYFDIGGFCYANSAAEYSLVESPTHSGRYAAAYRISGQAADGLQARCVRHGELPKQAYYGAWFYIPDPVTRADTWNLFHFEGRSREDPQSEEQHGLWDVSLRVDTDGALRAYVFDFLRSMTVPIPDGQEIPLRTWFHLEVHLERSADETGRFELYINGVQVWSTSDVVTDDTELGQWYVGNFAAQISPELNTLYVDDVTIDRVRHGADD